MKSLTKEDAAVISNNSLNSKIISDSTKVAKYERRRKKTRKRKATTSI